MIPCAVFSATFKKLPEFSSWMVASMLHFSDAQVWGVFAKRQSPLNV